MSETPEDFTSKLFTEGSEELQNIFRELAAKAGWPEEVAGKVSVKMNSEGVNLQYDDSLDDQIFDLEYGKFGQPPQAAIRKLEQEALKKFKEVKTKEAFKVLEDSGLF
jgi:hypothetical protein